MFRRTSVPAGLLVALFVLTSLLLPAQTASRIATSIDEHKLTTLQGNVHPQARVQNDRGIADGNLPMERMILVLKRSDAQEKTLAAAIQAMHDPKSASFHKWLTPQQFGSLYGPADADIATVSGWLKGHGFQVTGVAKGKGTIEFSGKADQVSAAFHTSIHSYVVDGKQHYANATNPSIPAALAPVVGGVLSLHNFVKEPHGRILGKESIVSGTDGRKNLKPQTTFQDGAHAVGPGDLWTIYNATPLITASSNAINGAGQTIAIVGRSDLATDDIKGFRTNILPAPYNAILPFTQINNGPDPGIVSGDDLEQALDVEYSSAMAPAAQIDLVVSGSTNTTDGVDLSALYIVDNNLAPVMSTSYGLCEAALGTAGNEFINQLWEQAAAQGITSLVSAGDNGSAGCDLVGPSGSDSIGYVADEGLQVSGTASTPYNIAVGGNEFTNDTSAYWSSTSLAGPAPLTTALSYIPETVWNESCSPLVCGNEGADIAAGSGGKSGCFVPTLDGNGNIIACSGGYAQPDWQAGVAGIAADGARHLPDVSLTAAGHDGYIVCFEGSCDNQSVYVVGGTSASSPSFAGIMSLVNQKTGSRQGQANYTLYRLAAKEFGTAAAPDSANLASCNATQGNAIGSQCIFQDVTTGTNAVPCDGGTLNCSSTTVGVYGVLTDYAATPGYDSATGLGSVNVTNLVNHWNDVTVTPTTTSLSLGATASTFGSPVSLAVAVAPTSGSGTPTGNVALITDSTIVSAAGAGTVTLTNGAFSGTISSLPGGTYDLSARYAGDTTFGSSTSTGSKIVVSPAASSTQLAFTANDPVTGAQLTGATLPYGSVISATATAVGISGQAAPTGTVTFKSGTTVITSQTTDPTGVATYVSKGYDIGKYTWIASYGGNSNYKGSISPSASFTIGQATTTLSLLSSTSYVVGSGSSTLTAIVNTDSFLSNPTGTITFAVNGKSVGTSPLAVYASPSTGTSEAVATFSLPASLLAAGANAVSASYAGDTNYTGATSISLSIGYSSVAPVNSIGLAVSSNALSINQPVTITATVANGSIPATAGTVTFTDNGLVLGTAQVVGSNPAKGYTTGTAVLKTILAPGSHSIVASYAGILSAPAAVASSAATVTVTGKETTTALLSAVADATNPSNYDLTATITGYGVAAPSLGVDFAETSVVSDLGTVNVDPKSAVHTFLSPGFYSAADPVGASPSSSIVGDFNGDGIPDFATANASFSASTISVFLGNGDGTFKSPVLYTAGIFADAITSGDFNGDGVIDIAVTNQYNSSFANGYVSIFLGNGDGTFQPQIAANMPGYSINTVVGDFNRDGILDIAAVQYYPMQISVEFGNGDGTFQAPQNYAIGYNDFSAYDMAGGDFNGDGAMDLVEVNAQDQSAEVFMNSGNGTFTLGVNLTTGGGPEWVSVGDVNLDGKQDVVVSNYGSNTISVFLGNGDGTFKDKTDYPVDGYASSLTIADFNGDGKPDLAAAYYVTNPIGNLSAIGILDGNGDGTFGAVKDVSTGQIHGAGVTAADLNGDGTLDIISSDIGGGDVQSQNVSILLNVTQGKATATNVPVAGAADAQQIVQATYSGDTNYNASSSAGVIVKSFGAKATPQILWTPATPWGAGVPLGTAVLNATTRGGIPGTFSYTAQLGTNAAVPVTASSTLTAVGSYTIVATFTPVDSTSYTTATATQVVAIDASDFALQTSVNTLNITAGQSGTFTATVPSLYEFAGQVTLSGSQLPGGFTFTAAPATVAAGGTSTITIATTGLSSANATKSKQHASNANGTGWNGWTTGGLALSCLFALPLLSRRTRNLYSRQLAILICLGLAIGMSACGGSSYSTSDSIGLTSSASSAASGSAVTLTATINGKRSTYGGTVTFYSGSTALGAPVSVGGSTATLSVSGLPVGLDSLTAIYSGDQHDAGATSSAVSQLITGQTSVQINATSGTTTHSAIVQVILQ